VLIVGAGSGNDVAVALSEGATHVDAVEIDPTIRALGKKYHADKPYRDPRVTVHINDGRAFIQNDHGKYNLILFALPDSLTLLSGQGSLRLENYLFTKESMKTVKKHLLPGGTFAMYNYYETYLLDRYASTLKDVYGQAPCQEVGDALAARKQAVLTTGAGATVNCQTAWTGTHVSAPTDDYPFPYLAQRRIPSFYWHTLLLMLAAALILIRFFARLRLAQIGLYAWRYWRTTQKSYFLQAFLIANAVGPNGVLTSFTGTPQTMTGAPNSLSVAF
jgi:hypothetical protein